MSKFDDKLQSQSHLTSKARTSECGANTDDSKLYMDCPMGNNSCPFCAESRYNPKTGNDDGDISLFCGRAPPSWDIRVMSLPKCPEKMSASELRMWQKKMKERMPTWQIK